MIDQVDLRIREWISVMLESIDISFNLPGDKYTGRGVNVL